MTDAERSNAVSRFPRSAADEPTEPGGRSLDERLCEHLIAEGRLTHANLERALELRAQQAKVEPLRDLLIKLGLVSERDVAVALSNLLALPLIERKDFPRPIHVSQGVSLNFLIQHKVLILADEDERLSLAVADPQNVFALKSIRLATGKATDICVGLGTEIEQALQERVDAASAARRTDHPAAGTAYQDDVEQLKELASGAPVIKLVNHVIQRAVEMGASDIHVEPFATHLKVRYRVDGVLFQVESPPADSSAAIISRVKIMASLNIAERRLPQDGRFKLRVGGEMIDLRVSTVPTVYGESLVLRLLRRDDSALSFGPLGYSVEMQQQLLRVLDRPHGILLVTGPTGSGKTTTLYAALKHLNTAERKILTVEDPVEYNIEGVNQIQAKAQIGLTFANALRSIVRQDPDVIMIGEMRDTETAKIAVQSALTGHLVLSTLHTNDSAGSITRLLDMGVEDYLLASTVNAVVAQRLVRILCPACREAYQPSSAQIRQWRLERFTDGAEPRLFQAVGCGQCGGTGYRGRIAIVELLAMSEPIRRLVLAHAEAGKISQLAASEGMRNMFEDGLVKALAGTTTVEEVARVTQEA